MLTGIPISAYALPSGHLPAWTAAASKSIVQGFPPKPKFSVDQIPDLSGRTALVTGGASGIGKETVKVLLQKNAKVYIATRNKEQAEAAISELKASTGKEALFVHLDLANLASARKAAQDFLARESQLHFLFCNAGVMLCPIDFVAEDGFDMQFGTNVIGHFLLTELLLPALEAGAKSSSDGHSRVVTTSSSAAYFGEIKYDTLKDGPARRKFGTNALYYQSKLGNAMVARESARRYADKGILCYSCNPGNLWTGLQRHANFILYYSLKLATYPAPMGALTQLWGATMPEAIQYNGEYLIPWARVGRCREEVYDPKETEKLWAWLEENTKPTRA